MGNKYKFSKDKKPYPKDSEYVTVTCRIKKADYDKMRLIYFFNPMFFGDFLTYGINCFEKSKRFKEKVKSINKIFKEALN